MRTDVAEETREQINTNSRGCYIIRFKNSDGLCYTSMRLRHLSDVNVNVVNINVVPLTVCSFMAVLFVWATLYRVYKTNKLIN